jgi:hypothetical protein
MIHAQTLATNNSIGFIEKTYREKDPEYADFSIRQQQHLLGRLSEEWTRSECIEAPPRPERKVWLPPRPEAPIKARRGLKKCEMIRAEIRAANNSIAFIEKTYREKDPEYADFSIRQQQHLLERLSEEWVTSECREAPPTTEKKARK